MKTESQVLAAYSSAHYEIYEPEIFLRVGEKSEPMDEENEKRLNELSEMLREYTTILYMYLPSIV
jgi:hypothetical protein